MKVLQVQYVPAIFIILQSFMSCVDPKNNDTADNDYGTADYFSALTRVFNQK
jgi:hypothetical protein